MKIHDDFKHWFWRTFWRKYYSIYLWDNLKFPLLCVATAVVGFFFGYWEIDKWMGDILVN